MSIQKTFFSIACLVLIAGAGLTIRYALRGDADVVDGAPISIDAEVVEQPITMADVLDLAVEARAHLADTLDDYTTRFIKQDRDRQGVLNQQEVMLMKVQTKLRDDLEEAPLRAYIQFVAPETSKGREVLWGEDLFDGKMCVHETGLLGLKRLYIDPNGILAMQGQRYPISTLGMVNLLERLIERGERDRHNPNITITSVPDHPYDDLNTELLQITCSEPRGGEDDFSFAELVIDRERMLLLMYRSYGWPEQPGEEAPLLESYAYHDVVINVGLTDEDFSPDNPNYQFPRF